MRPSAAGLAGRWLKLHVAVDANTGEITAHLLTEGHADAAQVPDLLRQPEGVIASVTLTAPTMVPLKLQSAELCSRHLS